MTALEFMETTQKNEKGNTNTTKLIINKYLNISPSLTTPPPESIDFFKEISISNLRLTNLDQIIEDERFQEDPSLIPLIQTPPQSAASSINLSESLSGYNRKSFLRLNQEFRKNHSEFKYNLQNSFNRLKNLKEKYFKKNLNNLSIADYKYELEKQKEDSENDFTEDENDDSLYQRTLNKFDLYWESRCLRLSSEWERLRKKFIYIQGKKLHLNRTSRLVKNSSKKINFKNELKNFTERYKPTFNYFQRNLLKSECLCNLKLTKKETCLLCNSNSISFENQLNINRTVDAINLDHSYTRLPNYNVSNNDVISNQSNFKNLEFLDSVDDDILNDLVNKRLNNLFGLSNIQENKNSNLINHHNIESLPIFTNEDLTSILDGNKSLEVDEEFIPVNESKLKLKTYDESILKQHRYHYNKRNSSPDETSCLEAKKLKKISSHSRSSTSSELFSNFETCLVQSKNDRLNLNNTINDETFSHKKNIPLPLLDISTPGWREVEIEPLSDSLQIDEEIDNQAILNRHKIAELKEKVSLCCKEKNLNHQESTREEKYVKVDFSKFNFEWPERKFPLTETEYQDIIKNC